MGYLSRGGGESIIIFGTITRDARYHEFESGFRVTNFSVRYGVDYGEDGEKSGKFMDVKAWGRDFDHALCDYCACLEKGDFVLVAGTMKKDNKPDQDGNDRWYLNAEYVAAQQTVQPEESDYDEDAPEQDPPPPQYADEDYPEALR